MKNVKKSTKIDLIIGTLALFLIIGATIPVWLFLREEGATGSIADTLVVAIILCIPVIICLLLVSSFGLIINRKYGTGIIGVISHILFGMLWILLSGSIFENDVVTYLMQVVVFSLFGSIMYLGSGGKKNQKDNFTEPDSNRLDFRGWIITVAFIVLIFVFVSLTTGIGRVSLNISDGIIDSFNITGLLISLGLVASYLTVKKNRDGLFLWGLFFILNILGSVLAISSDFITLPDSLAWMSRFSLNPLNYLKFHVLVMSVVGLFFILNALIFNPMWKIGNTEKNGIHDTKIKNKGWIFSITLVSILIALFGLWLKSTAMDDTDSNEATKSSVSSQSTTDKNDLTVKNVMADNQLMLAVIVKYATIQDNNEQLDHFSLKDKIQFVESKTDDKTMRYDIENNSKISYITVAKTKDNKNRVVFFDSSDNKLSSMTLTSIIKLVNQKVSEQSLDKIVKKISVQSDEQDGSSSKSSQQSQKSTAAQDVTIKDLQEGYLQSDTAMKAILYYAEHNPNALSMWKNFANETVPLDIHPNSGGFSVTLPESGGAGMVTESSEAMQNGTHDLTISVSVPGPSNPKYVATQQEIVDFVNDAGGKSVISGIQYQVQSYDPSSVVDDDEDDDYDDDDYDDEDDDYDDDDYDDEDY